LRFNEARVGQKEEGMVRDFFVLTDGWDKDADFHVAEGTRVGPLPWHGMADQLYGKEARPVGLGETFMEKYNTRWVGPETLKRSAGAVARR
jgi:hypothetical protein